MGVLTENNVEKLTMILERLKSGKIREDVDSKEIEKLINELEKALKIKQNK